MGAQISYRPDYYGRGDGVLHRFFNTYTKGMYPQGTGWKTRGDTADGRPPTVAQGLGTTEWWCPFHGQLTELETLLFNRALNTFN